MDTYQQMADATGPPGTALGARVAYRSNRRSTVWLDELQRYLSGRDGLTADTVRALLTVFGPIVLQGQCTELSVDSW
jgi:hypothetical protein